VILLDTNILVRNADPTDAHFSTVSTAIRTLHARGEDLCVVPQNIYEFWATATRPLSANGLGLTASECRTRVSQIKQRFRLLPDMPALYDEWEALVVTHACHGRVSFDARLVAAMRTHGIARILTFNGSDFARFPGFMVIDPVTVAGSSALPPGHTP
jgi:predicted nucleic acid-binding protein